MQDTPLDTPHAVQARLEAIERDLAIRQPALEQAALAWFRQKREKERAWARAFLAAEGTAGERKAHADLAASVIGTQEEAEWEALRAVTRTLETRASIGQTILRTQARA